MPNKTNQVPRNNHNDFDVESAQWNQNRKCSMSHHQNLSHQTQSNVNQQQYNQDYQEESQTPQHDIQMERDDQQFRKTEEQNDYSNNYNSNEQTDYAERDYSDARYKPSNYSEYVNQDYTFNNQNEYNTSFDDRNELNGHHSAIIRVGDTSDIESCDESYSQNVADSGTDRRGTEQTKIGVDEDQGKSSSTRYNMRNQTYANHFVTAATRFDTPDSCDQTVNQVQPKHKNIKAMPLNNQPPQHTQRNIPKEKRHQVLNYVERTSIHSNDSSDEQHPTVNRRNAVSESKYRNGHIIENSEIPYANGQAQVQQNSSSQHFSEVNRYSQGSTHKQAFTPNQNGQRCAPVVQNQISTNPFARKIEIEKNDESVTGSNSKSSVQNVVAHFNKVQQNRGASTTQKKKEKLQSSPSTELIQPEILSREKNGINKDRRAQTLSLHKKHNEFYETVCQNQDLPPKQRDMAQQDSLHKKQTVTSPVDTLHSGPEAPQIPISPTSAVTCNKFKAAQSKNSPVSTDSALSSDDTFPNPPSSILGAQIQLENGAKTDFEAEAHLLLCYFKNHRAILNYLNIGLAESLWAKVDKMPNCKIELKVIEENTEKTKETTTREKILRRVSSKSKNTKKLLSKKTKDTVKSKLEIVNVQEAAISANIVKPAKNLPYKRKSESSDEEQICTTEEKQRPIGDHISDDEQQIIQDFEDVSKQMNSSRPTSNSTISNEPKKVTNDCDNGCLRTDTDDTNFEEIQESLQKTEEANAPRDLEKRYTPQPLNYDEGIKSDSRWTFLKKSGRFMKKSAAALIARKQTSAANSPVPLHKGLHKRSLTADAQRSLTREQLTESRIAAEIRNLKEREEELRRSRSELGLPSLEDIVDTWKSAENQNMHQQKNNMSPMRYGIQADSRQSGALPPLRGARSYDHLHAAIDDERCNTEPRVAKSESFHHLQASLGSMGHINKTEEGYYTYESDTTRTSNYNSEQRVNGLHKARKVRLAVHDPSPPPVNPKVKHVEVKVRQAESANTTLNNRRGPPSRLRRNYVEEYPSVRL